VKIEIVLGSHDLEQQFARLLLIGVEVSAQIVQFAKQPLAPGGCRSHQVAQRTRLVEKSVKMR
jgi:hypothetical protein